MHLYLFMGGPIFDKVKSGLQQVIPIMSAAVQSILGLAPAWDNIKEILVGLIPTFTTAGKILQKSII
jgi:hypothetical protein